MLQKGGEERQKCFLEITNFHFKCNFLSKFAPGYIPHKNRLERDDIIRVLGTISLPNGKTAAEEGIIGDVNGSRFKISEGETSAFYIASVPRDKENQYLKYQLSSGIELDQYAGEGVWNGSRSVIGRHNAQILEFDSHDLTGINLTILPRDYTVSGSISFPESISSPAGGGYISMELTAFKENRERVRYYDWLFIPEGEHSTDFRIDIPAEDSGLKFYLYYYSSSLNGKGYEKVGYYSGNGTTADSSKRYYFPLSGSDTQVFMQLLPLPD